MQHTLVAVFDNRSDAQNAMNDLLAAGFSRQEMRLSEDDTAGQQAAPGGAAKDDGEGSITSSIKHFFSDLFGSHDSEHARKYADAVTRGHYVLTLTAADEPEVERAAGIVERHGPIDIDEQAATWSGGPAAAGLRGAGAGARQQAASMSQQQGGQGSQQRGDTGAQSGTLPGTQAREIPVTPDEGAQGDMPRAGVRVYTTELIIEEVADDALAGDDSAYRSHWDSNYAGGGNSYDEYEPAYRYGSSMAGSDAYKGRKWDEAEPGLKSDWEARNPGSAWEKFKAAIRHGWEKISS